MQPIQINGPSPQMLASKPSEHMQQAALFCWANIMIRHYPEWFFMLEFMFAVPNGGKRGIVTAGKLKVEGVKKGVPDTMLPFPSQGYHGLFIEMKTLSGGRVSPEQRKYIDYLNSQNYLAISSNGYCNARDSLLNYLGMMNSHFQF